ncbi:MAG: alpha-glucuronidase [Clostridia bacterium]|nr:alpha-glucuronidase [Clostridia bacterium]
MNKQPCRAWLPFLAEDVPPQCDAPVKVAEFELKTGCAALGVSAPELRLDHAMGDGYAVAVEDGKTVITGGDAGALYGAYAWLMAMAVGEAAPEGEQNPFYGLRMLNAWDNADGTIERGYSGRSLWFEGGRLSWDGARLRQLARMLASVGLNVLCVNNVNVKGEAAQLIEDELPELARLAAVFRPFGVRLMVSIDFSRPLVHGVGTADPLDEGVRRWWQERAEAVWRAIPDLAGFLVKADSEHRPGPFTYGRSHADGANMLARAIAPHGGILVWRAFVYNCQQDWRDQKTDRPMAAYETYAPLDGQFDDNVILQVKHGPFDFQVREPVSPTLYAMPNTRLAMEVQLAQEYTGHQIDLYAMNPLWRELADELPPGGVAAVAAVGNLGRDDNYTGHPFAAVNLYGFGRYAWNPFVEPENVIRRWARLTYRLPDTQEDALVHLLLSSREIYEKYTAPLGLCWMVRPGLHYGPNPSGYEYDAWGTYHRADRNGVGIDRTSEGTGYAAQYPPRERERYEALETCPDRLKLFFHRLPYDYRMSDGRTLIQRIYDDHFEGCAEAERMAETLRTLDLPEPERSEAFRRMELQLANAREWRDVINTFFHRLSGVGDEKGRKIYD